MRVRSAFRGCGWQGGGGGCWRRRGMRTASHNTTSPPCNVSGGGSTIAYQLRRGDLRGEVLRCVQSVPVAQCCLGGLVWVVGGWEGESVVAWLHGCMVAWLHGCMVAWLHGCMVAWLHGCMVAWLHGCTICLNRCVCNGVVRGESFFVSSSQ